MPVVVGKCCMAAQISLAQGTCCCGGQVLPGARSDAKFVGTRLFLGLAMMATGSLLLGALTAMIGHIIWSWGPG